MKEIDERLTRAAIAAARSARNNGNHPFGAVLASQEGEILLKAENTVISEGDCTGHAETNLMRLASRKYPPEFLARCSLYTSAEPCPMCAGAIFWGNVRRVVYGLSEDRLYEMIGEDSKETLFLPCQSVFERGNKIIEVIGPILEEEASKVHEGFW